MSKHKNYADINNLIYATKLVKRRLQEQVDDDKILYEKTRLKYYKIAQDLEECARVAYSLAHVQDVELKCKEGLNENRPSIPSASIRQIQKAMDTIQKLSDSGILDALGGLVEEKPKNNVSTVARNNSTPVIIEDDLISTVSDSKMTESKRIVAEFFKAAKKLVIPGAVEQSANAQDCGIFWSTWFFARFRDHSFAYKATNLFRWTDKFIYAYAYHWKFGLLSKFRVDLDKWVNYLDDTSHNFPLPKMIFEIDEEGDEDIYCAEAIVIERLLKTVMYGSRFYPENLHTIENTVIMHHPELKGMSIEELLQSCRDS